MKLRLTISLFTIATGLALLPSFALADAVRGTLVHEETIRVAPSADAARVGEAGRGNELVIIDSSRDWVHVEAILRPPSHDEDATEEEAAGKTITGWVSTKGLVMTRRKTETGSSLAKLRTRKTRPATVVAGAMRRRMQCGFTIASMISCPPRRSPRRLSIARPIFAGKSSGRT